MSDETFECSLCEDSGQIVQETHKANGTITMKFIRCIVCKEMGRKPWLKKNSPKRDLRDFVK